MKPLNFILVGVGGQGILLSSDILCLVGLAHGYDVKKTDVHGMAQRGGSVISHVRMAEEVFSPVVPDGAADFLLAFEKLEACRWVHFLHKRGVAVVNQQAIPTLALAATTAPYPSDDQVIALLNARAAQVSIISSGEMASALGNLRVANVILLGALSRYMEIPVQTWRDAIAERVPPKVRALNLQAYEAGREAVGGGMLS
ncbi:MAG TPA: indolepyruvate oxidoreductase subunit beta [Anaerolineae bacterium]|nr:indolepyruvate oxidoreductase subunit beta [Anaerolineae bacterium]